MLKYSIVPHNSRDLWTNNVAIGYDHLRLRPYVNSNKSFAILIWSFPKTIGDHGCFGIPASYGAYGGKEYQSTQ